MMEWIKFLLFSNGVSHTVLLLSFIIAAGILLGKIKVGGISLGITFVLFSGIIMGHFGFDANPEVVHFLKEFGLILFVYSIGLQVGPGFFSSFKSGGVSLNFLAFASIFLGVLLTIGIHYLMKIPMPTMVGVLSGAVTNTPGLGAAQQAYFNVHKVEDNTISMAYAVAYPLAVIGIILTMNILKAVFGISLEKEREDMVETDGKDSILLLSIEVENPAIFGKTIKEIAHLVESGFVVSRVLHNETGRIEIPSSGTVLNEGDKIYVVTSPEKSDTVRALVGKEIEMDKEKWETLDKQMASRQIIITKPGINGKSLAQLNLRHNFGINITRVNRAGLDLVAQPKLQLQIGDRVTVVGDLTAIKSAERVLGNQMKRLNEPNLIPIFIGIFLGVILGSIPIYIPGIPQALQLGLAGGPLIVAILMSAFGPKYKMVTYTTMSANLMMREIGICLFLACVGLGAGKGFIETVVNRGYVWVLLGFIITVLPPLIVGIFARKFLKLNYFSIIGMLGGSMTDPPALEYANELAENDSPAVGYATVYPLSMFLRILSAQVLILLFV